MLPRTPLGPRLRIGILPRHALPVEARSLSLSTKRMRLACLEVPVDTGLRVRFAQWKQPCLRGVLRSLKVRYPSRASKTSAFGMEVQMDGSCRVSCKVLPPGLSDELPGAIQAPTGAAD